MGLSTWALPGIGWLLMAVIMALLWPHQRRTRNAGFVDVCWADAGRSA